MVSLQATKQLFYWSVSRRRRGRGGQIQAMLLKRGLGFGWGQRPHVACGRGFRTACCKWYSTSESRPGEAHTPQLISIVEMRKFRPTFLCGIPQPFLSHADSKYAEFRTMDHASKSCLELQPRIGSYAGSGYQICPCQQHGCTGTQLQNKQLVSRRHRKI